MRDRYNHSPPSAGVYSNGQQARRLTEMGVAVVVVLVVMGVRGVLGGGTVAVSRRNREKRRGRERKRQGKERERKGKKKKNRGSCFRKLPLTDTTQSEGAKGNEKQQTPRTLSQGLVSGYYLNMCVFKRKTCLAADNLVNHKKQPHSKKVKNP